MLASRLQELRFWVRTHWLLIELWVPRGHQGQQIDASGDRASACDLCSLRRRPVSPPSGSSGGLAHWHVGSFGCGG